MLKPTLTKLRAWPPQVCRPLRTISVAAAALCACVQIHAGVFAYVPNHTGANVAVVDTASGAIVTTVPVGAAPIGVAASRDGRFVYVAGHNGSSVSVISTNSNTVLATIPVAGRPMGVAVSPDGLRLYVTHFATATASGGGSVAVNGTLSVIDTVARAVLTSVTVGANPAGVAVSPDGSNVYVANAGADTLSVVSAASNTVTSTIAVQSNPVGVAASADGLRVYVANSGSASLSVITVATLAVATNLRVGGYATGVSVSDDSSRVLVTNGFDNSVSTIDAATLTVSSTITAGVGQSPAGVDFAPAGIRALVVNTKSGSVSAANALAGTATTLTGSGLGWPISLGRFVSSTPACALDVSGDTLVTGASDGMLIVRYLLGLRGTALTQDITGIGSGVTPAMIEQRIAALNVDADGDNLELATTDGLLLVRALLQLTDAALIANARNTGFAGARSAAQILQWISDTHGTSCLL